MRILQVSPSTQYPPRSGDGRRLLGLADGFKKNGVHCVTVGANFVQDASGQVTLLPYKLSQIGRKYRAIRAWLGSGHYNEYVHCTQTWKRTVESVLQTDHFDVLYCHFIWTYPLLETLVGNRSLYLDTQNSEWHWFKSLRTTCRSRIAKQLCDSSCARSTEIMQMLPPTSTMVHVSDADERDYRSSRPDLSHVLVPNGTQINLRATAPDYESEKKHLLFLGSLGLKMSEDALQYFSVHFWPELKSFCSLTVAGSSPSKAVIHLTKQNQWKLRPNLSESEITQLYAETHFAILPFSYGNGSKLKFLESCARGVPIVSTTSGACGQSTIPSFALISDSPTDWANHLRKSRFVKSELDFEASQFAQKYDWSTLVSGLVTSMQPQAGHHS